MENNAEPNKVYSIDRSMANTSKAHIPGWGIDADPENDPTYPMKHWNGADHERLNYEKPPQQPIDMEVLHSVERPGITSVFGTSTPPSGLSGMIRRYAFKYSEATATHWMTLILADRVNVIEGYIDDLKNGHVPNPFMERGWHGEWKYNRKGFVQTVAIGAAVTASVILLLNLKNKKKVKPVA
ncbi:hypothetical protein [Segetibacter koreensis]|uniref:hypothetical protein n=1 Tax=Segetibacter koreensis TaxID=398037 RepID=UPI0003794EEF|nr:hypothetical protein [Segetibacter koreensis]